MPWKGQVSFYYSASEEGWSWALQSSCDKEGRSRKCVMHLATESGKADVDPQCLGESHQSWPGHTGNPVCRRGSAALTAFRGCTGLSVRSRLSLKPGKLWVDSGLGWESIYSTQYFLINGCTSHMVFKKHLHQDAKLFDLQPTSKIERQPGVVFLGEMLMTPMKRCSASFMVACGWTPNECWEKTAPTISLFQGFSIKSTQTGDTTIPWVIPFAHLRQRQPCQTYFQTLYFRFCGLIALNILCTADFHRF